MERQLGSGSKGSLRLRLEHVDDDAKQEIILFSCKICLCCFSSERKLMTHQLEHEKGLLDFACLFCGQRFSTRVEMYHHVDQQHNGK